MTSRQARERQGRRAERLAHGLLLLKGYRILARRFRCPVGEIDLIAKKGKNIVFVEVKSRRTLVTAQEAITPYQLERIRNAAQYFLVRNGRYQRLDQRVDAICLAPWHLPLHLTNVA